MENITENNKLIAEFMGAKQILTDHTEGNENICKEKGIEKWIIETWTRPEWYNDQIYNTYGYGPYSMAHLMLYHKSWDWLMPVVERIEKNGFVCHISWGIDTGYFTIEVDSDTESKTIESFNNTGSHIECVYNAVVEFIKWYTENEKYL